MTDFNTKCDILTWLVRNINDRNFDTLVIRYGVGVYAAVFIVNGDMGRGRIDSFVDESFDAFMGAFGFEDKTFTDLDDFIKACNENL